MARPILGLVLYCEFATGGRLSALWCKPGPDLSLGVSSFYLARTEVTAAGLTTLELAKFPLERLHVFFVHGDVILKLLHAIEIFLVVTLVA